MTVDKGLNLFQDRESFVFESSFFLSELELIKKDGGRKSHWVIIDERNFKNLLK